jgi:hypothetical protein
LFATMYAALAVIVVTFTMFGAAMLSSKYNSHCYCFTC